MNVCNIMAVTCIIAIIKPLHPLTCGPQAWDFINHSTLTAMIYLLRIILQILMNVELPLAHVIPMLHVPTLMEAMSVNALLGSLGMELTVQVGVITCTNTNISLYNLHSLFLETMNMNSKLYFMHQWKSTYLLCIIMSTDKRSIFLSPLFHLYACTITCRKILTCETTLYCRY